MRARVEFIHGSSFTSRGRPIFKKGQVKILTDLDDIRYFKNQGPFKVTMLEENTPGESKSESEEDGPAENDTPLLAWKPNSKRSVLVAAATSRVIVVADADTNAQIVDLLRSFDEINAS